MDGRQRFTNERSNSVFRHLNFDGLVARFTGKHIQIIVVIFVISEQEVEQVAGEATGGNSYKKGKFGAKEVPKTREKS